MDVEVAKPIVDEVLTWMKSGQDFVVAQAPDLARQVITWGVVQNAMAIMVGLTLCGVSWWCAGFSIRKRDAWREAIANHRRQRPNEWVGLDFPGEAVFSIILGIIAMFFGVVFFFVGTYNLSFVLAAPKLYLLHELHSAVAG